MKKLMMALLVASTLVSCTKEGISDEIVGEISKSKKSGRPLPESVVNIDLYVDPTGTGDLENLSLVDVSRIDLGTQYPLGYNPVYDTLNPVKQANDIAINHDSKVLKVDGIPFTAAAFTIIVQNLNMEHYWLKVTSVNAFDYVKIYDKAYAEGPYGRDIHVLGNGVRWHPFKRSEYANSARFNVRVLSN